ncbi:MAG: alcohol dehydrogenase catalytic domain-containing protein [Chloroflexi bacterium]|nr:alcohol dehydrogenase catalytic domain-containing protein [Chloroflexota bacterium]
MKAIYVERHIPKMLLTKALRPAWEGVVWTPLSPAKVVEAPDPLLPGPRWLRVRNRQCGICASDVSLLFVKVHPAVAPAALPGNTRFYLGHEVVGEVSEVGEAVTRFRPGDRVVMYTRFIGANCLTQEIAPPCRFCAEGQTRLCENASLRRGPVGQGGGWGDTYTAHEAEILPAHPDLTDDQAALVEPAAVALHGVLRRPPQSGEQALVIGAGIIGLLTVQAVKAVQPDCRLTVLARYPHQAEAARRLGADEVVRGRENLYPELARLTGAKYYTGPMNRGMLLGGFDVIYDCVGSADTINDSLRWARARGAVVMVGIDLALLNVDLNPVWYQEVDLLGSNSFGVDDLHGSRKLTFEHVMDLFRAGKFTDEGLITQRFPLSEYKRAIQTSLAKAAEKPIKVMFDLK